MVSSSVPASPVSVRQLEHPQANISTPRGYVFPPAGPQYPAYSSRANDLALAPDSGKSPEQSPISESSSSPREASKSSISGVKLVSGLKRALSTSVVHSRRNGRKVDLLHSGLTTVQPRAMVSTGQLNWSQLNNEVAVYGESDYACVETDNEWSTTGTRASSPHEWCNVDQSSVDQEAANDPKSALNGKVPASSMSKWLAASAFSNALSWADKEVTIERSMKRKASQPVAATSWFRGRGMEKNKEKENSETRGRSLGLKWNMVLKPEEKVGDSVLPQPEYRGSSLSVSKKDRLGVRKMSLPETDHGTQKAISRMEREKIAPWEMMEPRPQGKSRERRWVKSMNALNLDIWPSVHLKSSQSSGALSATSASLADSACGRRSPSSNNEIAIKKDMPTRGDLQMSDKSPGRSQSPKWCSSSSDEAEDAEFELQGLSPRPITRMKSIGNLSMSKGGLKQSWCVNWE
ncbi:hypothetical protein EV426DRAFT_722134 [Tirmania nivea]|nr:hypothetical protein EV426DRAFT_722134 [Tirmania nivea]